MNQHKKYHKDTIKNKKIPQRYHKKYHKKYYTKPYTKEDIQQHLLVLLDKGFESERIMEDKKIMEDKNQRELWKTKKHKNEKPLAYVATYNKNNPEQFTEIIKYLEFKNYDKIKEILDTTKIIKNQRQPKDLKRILLSSTFRENTTQGVTKCNNKWCKICNIIFEGISYTLKNLETKFKINKDLSCNSKKHSLHNRM